MIYFLAKPDRSAIKIGTTIRLSQRLKQLAAEHGEGLEVLAVAEGSFGVEKALHGRFAHLRTVGEWFEPGDDLMGFIVSDARPWDGSDETIGTVSIRIDEDAQQLARQACSYTGESVVDYISRIVRERAGRDARDGAEKFLSESKARGKRSRASEGGKEPIE